MDFSPPALLFIYFKISKDNPIRTDSRYSVPLIFFKIELFEQQF